MKKVFIGLIIAALVSCNSKEQLSTPSSEFSPGIKLAELKNNKLEEISGLASSVNNPKMLWAHNDSGNGAEVFLIDENLKIRLTCVLENVENRDWEDIAAGPGPDPAKQYIYVGDIGDNDAQYQYKYIYRFEEPQWSESQEEKITITKFDKITFRLPDDRKDTETLLLDPHTKNLYVVSKREEPVYVYELKYPHSSTDTLTANELISLPFTQIVGGDFSSDGKEILIKSYTHVFYWKALVNKPLEVILKEPAKEIPYEIEPQGESITWAQDASGFYTLSEKNKDHKSYLYFYKRK